MKGFIAVILFLVLVLVGANTKHFSTAPVVAETEACALQDDCVAQRYSVTDGAIIPLDRDKCLADMEFSDAHTLAHRVSASAERMFRFSSIETSQFIKALLRRMASRMATLVSSSVRVYDTSRSLSWSNACEHYIFGMRRILI